MRKKLVHYLQCQGHSEGLYNQNMTIFTISSKLLVNFQPNLEQHHIISRSVLWENRITKFKVKVTTKVQNVSECLSGPYGMVVKHHKPECHAEKLIQRVQRQGHSEGLHN